MGIHNSVNERAWREVLRWERLHCGAAHPAPSSSPKCDIEKIKLVRFQGRPRDYSFKARVLNAFGYKLPFDRHDWTVRRPDRAPPGSPPPPPRGPR